MDGRGNLMLTAGYDSEEGVLSSERARSSRQLFSGLNLSAAQAAVLGQLAKNQLTTNSLVGNLNGSAWVIQTAPVQFGANGNLVPFRIGARVGTPFNAAAGQPNVPTSTVFSLTARSMPAVAII